MAKLFLNEGTEIEVKETAAEILALTNEKKIEEKASGASDNLIKLTWKKAEQKYIEGQNRYELFYIDKTIFLYMKRVLFFYD